MSSDTSIFTLEGLLDIAMSSDNFEHATKQATVFANGKFAGGDAFSDPDNKSAPCKGDVALSSFVWGHFKKIDQMTMKSSSATPIGVVIGVPMYNAGNVSGHQCLYEGTTMTSLKLTLTNYDKSGKLLPFGTAEFDNSYVSTVVYQYYTKVGPVVFLGLLPESSTITIAKRTYKHTTKGT